MEQINELRRIAKAALLAAEHKDGTVERQNPDVVDLAADCISRGSNVVLFGVKNTAQIDRKHLYRLAKNGHYIWHTSDASAEGGRAVDPRFINPLTGRPMTGSSSATALHVLYGINDVGIGTDGGGSVLAPALSLGLYSVMAKGMGLSGRMLRQSTDGITFTPGIGVISHSFRLAAETVLIIANDDSNIETISLSGMKMAIPSVDCVRLPDGSNMLERLVPAMGIIQGLGIDAREVDFPDCMDRRKSIAWAESMLTDHHFIMTYEGPIDFYGLGDSVYGAWGSTSTKNQAISGKYMVKIANMINATAITIPLGDASSGIVVLSRSGIECGLAVIALGLKLAAAFPTPAIFDDFFHSGWERRKNELLFSLQEEK